MSYLSVDLVPESKKRLLQWWRDALPEHPLHSSVFAHHMTIKFGPSAEDRRRMPSNTLVTLEVIGYGADSRGQAVVVRCRRLKSANAVPHITVATHNTRPVYSNELLQRGWTAVRGPVLFAADGATAIVKTNRRCLDLVRQIDAGLPLPPEPPHRRADATPHGELEAPVSESGPSAPSVGEPACLLTGPATPPATAPRPPPVQRAPLSTRAIVDARLESLLSRLPPSDVVATVAGHPWPLHRFVLAYGSRVLHVALHGAEGADDIGGAAAEVDLSATAPGETPEAVTAALIVKYHQFRQHDRSSAATDDRPELVALVDAVPVVVAWETPDLLRQTVSALVSGIRRAVAAACKAPSDDGAAEEALIDACRRVDDRLVPFLRSHAADVDVDAMQKAAVQGMWELVPLHPHRPLDFWASTALRRPLELHLLALHDTKTRMAMLLAERDLMEELVAIGSESEAAGETESASDPAIAPGGGADQGAAAATEAPPATDETSRTAISDAASRWSARLGSLLRTQEENCGVEAELEATGVDVKSFYVASRLVANVKQGGSLRDASLSLLRAHDSSLLIELLGAATKDSLARVFACDGLGLTASDYQAALLATAPESMSDYDYDEDGSDAVDNGPYDDGYDDDYDCYESW